MLARINPQTQGRGGVNGQEAFNASATGASPRFPKTLGRKNTGRNVALGGTITANTALPMLIAGMQKIASKPSSEYATARKRNRNRRRPNERPIQPAGREDVAPLGERLG
jgi:hypothetical protein